MLGGWLGQSKWAWGENKVSVTWVIQGQIRGHWLGGAKSRLNPCSRCLPRASSLCSSSPSCPGPAQLCSALCSPMDCSTPHFPVLYHVCSNSCPLSMMPSSHLLLSTPSPGHLPSIFPSIRVFSRVSSSHQIAKVLEFSFSPSNECSGLISFRIDWFDLLTVQGSLKSSLSNHSSKASILWCPAFLMVQLSRPYMTTYCKDHSFD